MAMEMVDKAAVAVEFGGKMMAGREGI